MTLNDYQREAYQTALYPNRGNNVTYTALGLAGEAGEVANEVKKVIRNDRGVVSIERREKLIDELGDCLWYIAACAEELDTDLEAIGRRNLDKLDQRKQTNQLKERS